MSHAFIADAMRRSERRNMRWYQNNLLRVLLSQKEKQARDIDQTIAIAAVLKKKLEEKVDLPVIVPERTVVPSDNLDLMKPIEPELLDILYKSTEKGATERYLHQRYKKPPEDKFYFRAVSSWDYGWQQKQSRLLQRDQNFGRCAVIRDTFYRKSNVGPDPPHYTQPSGGEVSICSEYACNAN